MCVFLFLFQFNSDSDPSTTENGERKKHRRKRAHKKERDERNHSESETVQSNASSSQNLLSNAQEMAVNIPENDITPNEETDVGSPHHVSTPKDTAITPVQAAVVSTAPEYSTANTDPENESKLDVDNEFCENRSDAGSTTASNAGSKHDVVVRMDYGTVEDTAQFPAAVTVVPKSQSSAENGSVDDTIDGASNATSNDVLNTVDIEDQTSDHDESDQDQDQEHTDEDQDQNQDQSDITKNPHTHDSTVPPKSHTVSSSPKRSSSHPAKSRRRSHKRKRSTSSPRRRHSQDPVTQIVQTSFDGTESTIMMTSF